MMSEQRRIYADAWDTYVDRFSGEGRPGDEWGTEASWTEVFGQLFIGVDKWQRAVEVGSGAGKYTERVLHGGEATVHAFDISQRFLDVLAERLGGYTTAGRLRTTLLDGLRPEQMFAAIEEAGWVRQVDAFYSIDAMVHVDFQYLIAYLLTAGLVLRQDGLLIVGVADVTTDSGFRKLMAELRPVFPVQSNRRPTAKFEWISRDVLRSVLDRLGFDVVTERRARDYEVTARLVDPTRAEAYRAALLSTPG
jgi:SAM-dependent methyltransferase